MNLTDLQEFVRSDSLLCVELVVWKKKKKKKKKCH